MGASRVVGSAYEDDYTIPGTQSQEGQDVLSSRFGSAVDGASAQLLFRADKGSIEDSDRADLIDQTLGAVREVDGVASVTVGDELQVSDDGAAALATIQFDDQKPTESVLDAVHDAAIVDSDGITSTIGGSAYNASEGEMSHVGEIIGLLVALLVLIITFGSFIAAGMPIITALVGVGTTISVLAVVSHVTTVSTATPAFSSMLGLAVSIDYALFVLSRHRAELAGGLAPRDAMARALGTAGGAVVFAGATVVVSLAGLSVVGIPLLTVMALGGSFAVIMSVLAALTLLPAVALLLGARLTPKKRLPRKLRRKRTDGGATPPTLAERWVNLATRIPAATILLVVLGVGALAVPATQLSLALPDASTKPVGSDARENFDAIAESFGPGWNAPLLVTVDILDSDDPTATMTDLSQRSRNCPA